jgi:hypothetical protein
MKEVTLLHRQVNPSWVQQGRVTSQLFKPTPKDGAKLSLYDGDQISAVDAFTHYTDELRLKSLGVMSISVGECAACNLKALPDPVPFPEHVIVDFSGLPQNQVEKKAKLLKAYAEARGWQFDAGVR